MSLKPLTNESDLFYSLQAACFCIFSCSCNSALYCRTGEVCNIALGQGTRLNWVLVNLSGHVCEDDDDDDDDDYSDED